MNGAIDILAQAETLLEEHTSATAATPRCNGRRSRKRFEAQRIFADRLSTNGKWLIIDEPQIMARELRRIAAKS